MSTSKDVSSPISVGIRPRPQMRLSGRFSMCDGQRCLGPARCTHAHSVQEMRIWNDELEASRGTHSEESGTSATSYSMLGYASRPRNQDQLPSLPFPWPPPHPVSPPPGFSSGATPNPLSPRTTVVTDPKEYYAEPGKTSDGRLDQDPRSTFTLLEEEFPSLMPHSFSRPTEHQLSGHDMPSIQPLMENLWLNAGPPSSLVNAATPDVPPNPQGSLFPPITVPLSSREAHPAAVGGQSVFASTAEQRTHSQMVNVPEPIFDPSMVALNSSIQQPTHDSHSAAQEQFFQPSLTAPMPPGPSTNPGFGGIPRERAPSLPVIQQPLTRQNYKRKFRALLSSEESSHSEILEEKCNGEYQLVLYQRGTKPPWLTRQAKPGHKQYGYLRGISSDQIAYATQASEGAFIVQDGREIPVDLLPENYSNTEEKLYVAFHTKTMKELDRKPLPQGQVRVRFALKHFYFNQLRRSVEKIPDEVVERILPEKRDFGSEVCLQSIPDHIYRSLQLSGCSTDQLQALRTIVSCPPTGPPVVIAGPFGTGKTRILATAAHFFLLQKGMQPVRILVCTQQQVSADTFLECYCDVMERKGEYIVRLITEHGIRKSQFPQWCKTVARFKESFRAYPDSNYLIVTTCMTALNLQSDAVKRDFFTHILLDEGAQLREPEIVAPLCFATSNTKIVIVGDQYQVGPAMLVLGDEAQRNGLAFSLLDRLYQHYRGIGGAADAYSATLITNYRCHQGIVKLSEKLFYGIPLECAVPADTTHPDAPFPLAFVCSSIDDRSQIENARGYYENEASIAVEEVDRYTDVRKWPHQWGERDMSQFCLISPTRYQLTLVSQVMSKMREPPWPRHIPRNTGASQRRKDIRRFPTYDIQGRQYRGIFVSTSEPTETDGSSRNPTKSMCDPFVFNTVITRAQSLVVCIGNPFMLLKTEQQMIRKYGKRIKCWSTYLNFCLENGTVSTHGSLGLSELERQKCMERLRNLLKVEFARSASNSQVEVKQSHPQLRSQVSCPPTTGGAGAIPQYKLVHAQETKEKLPLNPLPTPAQSTENEERESAMLRQDTNVYDLDLKLEREFELEDRLGRGGFGVVYRVKNKLDDGEYALKIIKLPTHKSQKEKVMREVHALKKLDHPRIMRYFQSWPARVRNQTILESFERKSDPLACAELSSYSLRVAGESPTIVATDKEEDEEGDEEPRSKFPWCLFIQIQLCREDTLKDWLLNNIHDRPRKRVFQYLEQILEAVVYIHRKGLLHRDLKPSNIFFSQEDGGIKVGDFGLVAGSISPGSSLQMQSHSGQVGTWFYMAPEQLSPGRKYDQKVDIFALGVIFFEMNYPMTAQERLQVLTEVRLVFELPEKFTEEFPLEADFVKKLLDPKAGRRPSAEVVSEDLKALSAVLGTLPAPLVRDSNSDPSSVEGDLQVGPQHKALAGLQEEELDLSDSGIAGDSQTNSELCHPKFPGIRFLSDSPWRDSVTADGNTIVWAEIGISFDIPEGAVPPEESLNLTVWPCVKGPFVLPPGYDLASPVFIVGPEIKFHKEILLQMAHFVQLQSPDDCQRLTFLSAPSTPQSNKGEEPRYHFKVFKRGMFQVGQSVGSVELSHFCALAIGRETNAGGDVTLYSVQLYQSVAAQKALFTVSICHPLYNENLRKFLEQQYPGANFQHTVKEPVQFAQDEVTLDIPTDSMSGWMVFPDQNPCKIARDEVDLPLHSRDCATREPTNYPPKMWLTLVQPQGTPHRVLRSCSLLVQGLTKPLSFLLQLRKTKRSGSNSASAAQPELKSLRLDHKPKERDLMNEVAAQIPAKWRKLAFELELERHTIERIEKEYGTDTIRCYDEVFGEWGKQCSPTEHTWATIIQALRAPQVKETALADRLENKFAK